MTREEMFGLVKGEMVVVKGSGKVYRCTHVRQPRTDEERTQIRAEMEKQKAETGYYSGRALEDSGDVYFVQQRNGKDYGPSRVLKPENIEKVAVAKEPTKEPAPRAKEWKLSDLRARSAAGLTGAKLFK